MLYKVKGEKLLAVLSTFNLLRMDFASLQTKLSKLNVIFSAIGRLFTGISEQTISHNLLHPGLSFYKLLSTPDIYSSMG